VRRIGPLLVCALLLASCDSSAPVSSATHEDIGGATTTALSYYRGHGTWDGFAEAASALPYAATTFFAAPGSRGPGVSVMAASDDSITMVATANGRYRCTTIRSGPWWQGFGEGSGYPASPHDCEADPVPDMDLVVAQGDLVAGQMALIVYGRDHRGFDGFAAATGDVTAGMWPVRWSKDGADAPPHRVVVVEEGEKDATLAVKTDDGRYVCFYIQRSTPRTTLTGKGTGFPDSTQECLDSDPAD